MSKHKNIIKTGKGNRGIGAEFHRRFYKLSEFREGPSN